MNTAQLQDLDRRHIWHPFTPMSLWLDSEPLVIRAAEGFYLIDTDGRRYLDGVSSLWCNVHGHRVPEIDDAIKDQLTQVAHSTLLGLAGEQSILLADDLMRLVPANLKKVFFSDAGATATEIAFKIAAQYWFNLGHREKHRFIAFSEAYHGDTIGAMSIGRMPAFHRPYLPLLFPVDFAPTPSDSAAAERSLAVVETTLRANAGGVAAICIEPIVQGAGGIIVQPPGFLKALRELADRHNALLICDEVATGFARTGRMFAVEHEQVLPDLMTVAKGLTGGYLPLAATFATQTIFDAFLGAPSEGKTFYHGHTYTGNPLACAAARASLRLMNQQDLVGRVAANSVELAAMLSPLADLPHVAQVRQKGYMVGIELALDKERGIPFDAARRTGAAVCAAVRDHGVIIRPLGDVIVLMPAPAMGIDDLRKIVAAVAVEIGAIRA